MNLTEQEFERIVAEVIRRLLQHGVAVGERSSTAAEQVAAELVLKEKVVTLRTLEGRLAGITRLVVGPRAVVTPAVKDELKQRKIELVRQAAK